jgi:hypothetical protein
MKKYIQLTGIALLIMSSWSCQDKLKIHTLSTNLFI